MQTPRSILDGARTHARFESGVLTFSPMARASTVRGMGVFSTFAPRFVGVLLVAACSGRDFESAKTGASSKQSAGGASGSTGGRSEASDGPGGDRAGGAGGVKAGGASSSGGGAAGSQGGASASGGL